MKNGAETNIYDINQVSAMHIAAANGNADLGMHLANRDAKLDCKDKVSSGLIIKFSSWVRVQTLVLL